MMKIEIQSNLSQFIEASDMPEPFGTVQGRTAWLYALENQHLRVRVTDYGGILVSIEAPDRDGRIDHVVLGFADAESYAKQDASFGAMIGRFANRIAQSRFRIDGTWYETSRNDRGSTLHGGATGFGQRFWSATQTDEKLELSLISADGDQGFPGQLSVTATYRLDGCDLVLDLTATTTKATPVSLSTHPYFNLAGSGAGDCLAHLVALAADEFLKTDPYQIPTGERIPVAGTAFDFRMPRAMGERIREPVTQLEYGCGYDHYFPIAGNALANEERLAARVIDPFSGRVLEIFTTQPGMQFYTGNQLDGSMRGRSGLYRQSAGFAIEPHGFPNAVNQPSFPSAILRPGEVYTERTTYRFSVQ
jgi:aldose 1-epimerase